jgi:hypothetical protein
MTNDALLFEVMELIKAYETGLVKSFKNDPKETNLDIGYLGPLTMMQSILEAEIKAGEVHLEMSEAGIKVETATSNPAVENKIFEACSTVYDSSEKKTNDLFTFETDVNFTAEKPQLKARVTNKWVGRFNFDLETLVNGKLGNDGKVTLGGKDLNFGIQKCFNCFLKINAELVLPPLEFLVDLSKILNLIKGLLAQIKDDIDPSKLFNLICQFALRFGENLLCPANLVGLSLLLPSLFVKYSLDLLNFKIDATIAFGPIIKVAVSFLVSLLENIPKVIFPVIDCLINAIRSVEGALKTILDSANYIAEDLILSPIERVTNLVSDIIRDPKGYRIKEEQLEKLNKELENIKITDPKLTELEASIGKLLNGINPSITTKEDFFKTLLGEKGLVETLNEYLLLREKLTAEAEAPIIKKQETLKKELLAYDKRGFSKSSIGLEDNQAKAGIISSMPNRQREYVNGINSRLGSDISVGGGVKLDVASYLQKTFGINIVNEAAVEKDFDFANAFQDNVTDPAKRTISEFSNKIVKYLNEIKDFINYFVNGAIGLMKSFELFISQSLAADIKILGDIREVLNLIRLIRLLIELFDNGLSNCDKIKQNKKVFKDIVEAQNFNILVENLSSNDILNINQINPDDYLVLVSTDSMQRNIINLNDCGEAMAALGNKDLDLDAIYDSIRRNSIV